MSIITGTLFGLAIYAVRFYQSRSLGILALAVLVSGASGFLIMRIAAGVLVRLTGAETPRMEVVSALSTVSLLVIYLGFPLSFMEISFFEGKEITLPLALYLLLNLCIYLILRGRWLVLTALVAAAAAGIASGLLLPKGLVRVHFEQVSEAYFHQDRVRYEPLAGSDADAGPAQFRFHHAGHTRTGFFLSVNGSAEKSLAFPEAGRLGMEVGVIDPDKSIAPGRLTVEAIIGTGRVIKLGEVLINRQKISWKAFEFNIPASGKGVIRLQLHSMDESRENLKPLVIAGMVAYPARATEEGRVILCVLDALRADALSCYGSKDTSTPVIDRLAAQGVLFENAISPSSWTLPAVASILTSRMPSQHGAVSYLHVVHDRSLHTIPEILARRGVYTKASIGNWLVYPRLNYDKGFQDFYLEPSSRISAHSTDALMGEVTRWLRENPAGPFFLYMHNMDPHHPHLAPPPYSFGAGAKGELERLKAWLVMSIRIPYIYGLDLNAKDPLSQAEAIELRSRYLGEVEYVDDRLALLEETLRETGLWDETLLIITSDHGEEFQEHGTLRHGNNLNRELIRVPLILTGGAMKGNAGQRIETTVSLLDLYPTILDFFKAPSPPGALGRSLWPMIEVSGEEERTVFSELVEGFDHKYLLMSAVSGKYHFIKKVPLGEKAQVERLLYNWDTDPGETMNISEREKEKAKEIENAMEGFFDRLPGKRPLDAIGGKDEEIEIRLKALGYFK